MAKVVSFEKLCDIRDELEKKKKKVVLVLGIFDILHMGHVKLLVEAKKLGDILVVAVDHDSNARVLKGEGRPINNHRARIYVLSNLAPVDYVFMVPPFDLSKNITEFYNSFYLKLRPDIVATCMAAGKHGIIKKKHAENAQCKFVDIPYLYDKNTSKVVKLLGL